MKCEKCDNELKKLIFFTKQVVYCNTCRTYKIEYLTCDHDFMYVLFELANKTFQLRRVCKKCFYRDTSPIKQTPEKLRMAANKREIDYQAFKTEQINEEPDRINDFIKFIIK